VYAPYVRDTPVSFEVEPPSAAVMTERIISMLGTHPWLVAERGGEVVGFAYAGKHGVWGAGERKTYVSSVRPVTAGHLHNS